VRHTVRQNRMEPRVAQQDFDHAPGRWILPENGLYLLSNRAQHPS
jgi:hypothetical protein